MELQWWWVLAIILAVVLIKYIGLRGVVDSYQKKPSNKIFYIIGLFSIIYLVARYFFWNDSDSQLVYLIILFVITMAYIYIWKKSGYQFGTERYENTAAAKVVKFFGVIFIIVTTIFLLALIAFWLGWIKF